MTSESNITHAWMQTLLQPTITRDDRSSFHVVDCGYHGNDKDAATEELIVRAQGQAISVPVGVTLLLHHVQKALQAELGSLDQGYDIYDFNGSRLRSDQDLRDAVMAGRTPLSAQPSASPPPSHHLDDQREELAQIICQLMRDQTNESDHKLSKVCRQVDGLKAEMKEQKRELNIEFQALRKEIFAAVDSIKDTVGFTGAGKGDPAKVGDSVPIAEKDLARFEHEFWEGLHRLNDRINEMLKSVSNVISEHEDYLKRSCQSATQEVEAVADRCAMLDVRLTKVEKGTSLSIAGPPSNSDGRSPRTTLDSLRRMPSPLRMLSLSEASNRSPTRKLAGSPILKDIRATSVDSQSAGGSTSGCHSSSFILGYPGKNYTTQDEMRRINLNRSTEGSLIPGSHGSNSSKEASFHPMSSLSSTRSVDGMTTSVLSTRKGTSASSPKRTSATIPATLVSIPHPSPQSPQVGTIFKSVSNSV